MNDLGGLIGLISIRKMEKSGFGSGAWNLHVRVVVALGN